MRTAISQLELLEPRSLKDALRMLKDGPAVPLAGCTDLYVSLNFGTLEEQRFLNLWQLDALRAIRERSGVLSIGAVASYTEIIRSVHVQRQLPMLVEAARQIGGIQIQNRGTLGGNIANGSPAGDSLPVLAAVDAVVVLNSLDTERRVPLTEFYLGYRKTALKPDELITAVEIPRVEGKQWFRKVGTRAAQAISKVVMAAVRAPRPLLAIGSVAPTVVRATRTEAVLASGGSIRDAQEALMEEIHPIDDIRSTAEYRKKVAANLLARFLRETEM